MFNYVEYKLGNMRKPQSFLIQPMTDGHILVQSDKSIGSYDPETGTGRLSTKGSYFHHLAMYGKPYEFPAEFREKADDALNNQGPTTDLGGIPVVNTIQVIE